MKRAITYITIGIGGLFGVPFCLLRLIDTIPPQLFTPIWIVGLIFYGLVLWKGLMLLTDYKVSEGKG